MGTHHAAMDEGRFRKLAIETMVLVAIGMVLAFFGPFGTFELPLGKRMLYWVSLVLIGFPLFRGSSIIARRLSDSTSLPVTVSLLIAIGIAAIPMTAIVAALFFKLTLGQLVDWNGIGALYLQVWLLAALITGVTLLLFRDDAQHSHQNESSSTLLSRLPAVGAASEPHSLVSDGTHGLDLPLGFGPVLALKSEDHYVSVIGEGRTTLLLIRLRDAIALMPADAGWQVHRSWWVAHAAITSVEREGRSVSVTLSDGTIVPVSRDNQDKVKGLSLTR